jgi:hypothetical protein
VVYAKWIIADKERKKAFRKSLPRRKQRKVYQAAIQLYMSRQGDKQWLQKQLAVKATVRVVEREASNVKGVYDRQEAWSVSWQKKEDVMELVVDGGCLIALRI